ncbi:MAG TPA: Rnase Y domain-containing protein, partial [Verrucomicrobiota bacterium]|nr:Rnase Y domain-containing protein [Verrucomicrobiota bacterium]
MNLMAVIEWIQGGLGFLLGIGIGLLIWRWRCLARDKAFALQQAERLEETARQSETLIREARLAAQEEGIRLRQEAEDALAARRQECDGWQQRLAEREQLVNQ